ncbi:dynamin family protein [Actinomyces sp. B33]|uniref:dynamin family protein n=1 Tax=Actinomyces sp. B33 TaxID=2942131 RepID=UPI00234240B2|nr:dynamin family protein [Actinomyces sp. B33]MDC4233234.1 dynamin family protein [Actinomyces sp. B33]
MADERGLAALRDALAGVGPVLPVDAREDGEAARARAIRRLDDHVLPRLASLDAPLLGVVGGSTGAGKSALVNSLVGRVVSRSSAVRPTTRRPTLICRPEDAHWFLDARILPTLARVRVDEGAPAGAVEDERAGSSLAVTTCEGLADSLALVDAPDVDSVAAENRRLAGQLLDAADLWIFVTTAARYADAVPWRHLDEAAARGVDVAVVLNRVPAGARDEVEADLRRMLDERGLLAAPIFPVDEQDLVDSLLPTGAVAPIARWLGSLAADASARAEVARRALDGSIRSLADDAAVVVEMVAAHNEAVRRGEGILDEAVAHSLRRIRQGLGDGALLRGEVLARWQEVVGAWDISRTIDRTVSSLRDRLSAALRGRPSPVAPVEEALEEGLAGVIREELLRVRESAEEAMRGDRALAAVSATADSPSDALADEAARETTVAWQRALLGLVREQGGSRRTRARVLAVGVNIVAVALMIVLFSATGGLTGAEVGVAGASAVLAQRLLEAVFGDQGVRTMAARAESMLDEMCARALRDRLEPLARAVPGPIDASAIDEALRAVEGEGR